MFRTAQWRRHHDDRVIRRWQNFFLNVIGHPRISTPGFDPELWLFTKSHSLSKYSFSCDHHGICRYARELRKYRAHRARMKARQLIELHP